MAENCTAKGSNCGKIDLAADLPLVVVTLGLNLAVGLSIAPTTANPEAAPNLLRNKRRRKPGRRADPGASLPSKKGKGANPQLKRLIGADPRANRPLGKPAIGANHPSKGERDLARGADPDPTPDQQLQPNEHIDL